MSVSRKVIIEVLKTSLKIVVSSLALYFVFRKIDIPALWELLKKSNVLLLISGALCFILSKLVSAYRLNYFFRSVGIVIPEKTNLQLYLLGMFYNLFLPGGIGGDGYKVYYLNRNLQTPVKKGILATLFDRITGLMALALLCLIFALFIPNNPIHRIYIVAAIIIGIPVFYFIVYKWFNQFYDTLHFTNLLSLLTQLLQLACAFLILRSLGNNYHMAEYLFIFLISSVIAVIPFTIGGIGAREVAFLYAAKVLELSTEVSIALSLLFFIITAVVSLGGIYYTFSEIRSFKTTIT